MKNAELIRALHARGMSVNKPARAISSGRVHVSQVLNNVEGRGYLTRPKLAKLLTAQELDMVGWSAYGKIKT